MINNLLNDLDINTRDGTISGERGQYSFLKTPTLLHVTCFKMG